MFDFLVISQRLNKGVVEVYPKFRLYPKSKDLMIRGGDFYAVYLDDLGLWSTNEQDCLSRIDHELEEYAKKFDGQAHVKYMWDSESGMIDSWHKYCQKQMRDSFHMLDEKVIFSNMKTTKEDYASKKLPYPLEEGDISAWDTLIGTLYSPEERHKLEWAIGSIVTGESTKIQKFIVLYGGVGTGKSTILNVVQKLFEGYYAVFDAKALGSSSNAFALEAFKSNPLVAIQHDGDLSRIEDNTRLNSLVSHELMTVNEKFKSTYSNSFKAFLFMGTNKPVKITDGKSGLIRRLIDVTPTGNKLSPTTYSRVVKEINFELGAIAFHCMNVYLEDPDCYDNYIPKNMMGASNDFYNFVEDSYRIFCKEDGTTLKAAWEMYKQYCDDAKVPAMAQLSKMRFKEELKNYFWNFDDRFNADDMRVRNYYSGFKKDVFLTQSPPEEVNNSPPIKFIFEEQKSIFDDMCSDCPAQYTKSTDESPETYWEKVTTTLKDIDTSKLHYVRVPENHIVIDFDIKDDSGKKSFKLNLEAANKWPATYAELSKSGQGIHLHYIYTGDVSLLQSIYDKDIEIKVFRGNSALRRKLTKCNNLPIATISSGLPLKEKGAKMVDFTTIKSEKGLRNMIIRNLNKEIHGYTKPSIDFIYKILEDAYTNGLHYDVSDMYDDIVHFALSSSNNADYCLKVVSKMRFKSEEASAPITSSDVPIVFFDCEVFPNLFMVNYKIMGADKNCVRLINPTPTQIEDILKYRLIGFNCLRYDNQMLYARLMGYSEYELYKLSQRIIKAKKGEKVDTFSEARNVSFTDIYDFASAGNKKSLKKLEIEMLNKAADPKEREKMDPELLKLLSKVKHHELGLPWDQPVPENLWNTVAEYCDDDVYATEAAFLYLKGDWTARQILADIADGTVNMTTNALSTKIIFGDNRNPQNEFNYRDLSKPVSGDRYLEYREKFGPDYIFRVFDNEGLPLYRDFDPEETLPDGYSILPFFPGYEFKDGISTYLGEVLGEGGKVYAEEGIYGGVWDGDVTGQHPSSILAEMLFGPRYTKAFKDIVDGRVSIKHQAWKDIDELFDGKLKPYIQKVKDGELTVKELANALKTVVNSVYGLTSAGFSNPFRDPNNIDNIVAKRGALFMTLLKREVQRKGFQVCHIKTDSIKIPDANEDIKNFVINFGKEFGYNFETEAEFVKYALVNKAVYIGLTKDGEWIATGDEFAEPYVYKTLFTHEPVIINDLAITFETKSALYLDCNESLPDVTGAEKELDKLESQYKKGFIGDTTFEAQSKPIVDEIAKGHDYHFVGKVGRFIPVKPNCGGGYLMREQNGKYYAATGTTGYRWMEADLIMNRPDVMDIVDMSYFNKLASDAINDINEVGHCGFNLYDFNWLVDPNQQYIPPSYETIDGFDRPCYDKGLPW